MKPHVYIQGILDMHAVDVDDNKCCPINDWLPNDFLDDSISAKIAYID